MLRDNDKYPNDEVFYDAFFDELRALKWLGWD